MNYNLAALLLNMFFMGYTTASKQYLMLSVHVTLAIITLVIHLEREKARDHITHELAQFIIRIKND